FKPEDDGYETVPVCNIRRRTIIPKALNNIYNEMIQITQDKKRIQAVDIEECTMNFQQCSENPVMKCKQKFVRINMQVKHNGKIFDEEFYIPSLCGCYLV
ncbi:CLUMA_CG014495, isoform A, partial [Clunio marinus]